MGVLLLTPAYAEQQSYTLDEAIAVALEKSRFKTISQHSIAIAEAQYKQALSTYWPTLSINANFIRQDETSIFKFPSQEIDVAPGMLPPVHVPALDVDILGRDTAHASIDLVYPLYTGGKRSSIIEQARLGLDIASTEVHRTRLQIVQDVKRYYYAALYARQLTQLAQDIAISFEVLKDITQALYNGGSERVSKLDLLQSQLAHKLAQTTLEELSARQQGALAALALTMGLDWRTDVKLATDGFPLENPDLALEALIDRAMQFNPQIEQLNLAVRAYGEKIKEARSARYPTLGLIASANQFNNELDGGLSTDQNKSSWQLMIGMELKLFDGGLISHRISQAEAEEARIEQQMHLLSESTATHVKHLFIQTAAARRQVSLSRDAVDTSEQNLDLSNRAYQTGAVDTEQVIKANLMHALVRANLARASHDQALHLSQIAYLLGSEAIE